MIATRNGTDIANNAIPIHLGFAAVAKLLEGKNAMANPATARQSKIIPMAIG
jgi:hypothetical protein